MLRSVADTSLVRKLVYEGVVSRLGMGRSFVFGMMCDVLHCRWCHFFSRVCDD